MIIQFPTAINLKPLTEEEKALVDRLKQEAIDRDIPLIELVKVITFGRIRKKTKQLPRDK